ncbi:MAG TPA: type VI secretion system baseplate subunit TssG [Candidatus Anaerobiospirillum stercoravium]|nr:type VI secretion system baseplate subunit TssG [Candidatus Anaerobiospirillum stercoravium]
MDQFDPLTPPNLTAPNLTAPAPEAAHAPDAVPPQGALLSKLSRRLRQTRGEVDFFALMRLIEALHPKLPRLGSAPSPQQEAVHLGQMPHLNFPERSLYSLEFQEPMGQAAGGKLELLVYFLGLCGVNGPLPLELNQYIYQRAFNQGDHTLRCFLDLINHRLLTLFYRAFAHHELPVSFDRADDPIGHALAALAGALPPERILTPVKAQALSAFLMNPLRSGANLALMLSAFFQHEIKVREFAPSRPKMAPQYQARLGRQNCSLNRNCQLGRHYFTCTQVITVELTNLSYRAALTFMPGGLGGQELCALLRLYLVKPLQVRLRLGITPDTIPAWSLGRRFKLSRSTFLPAGQDAPGAAGAKAPPGAAAGGPEGVRWIQLTLNLQHHHYRKEEEQPTAL